MQADSAGSSVKMPAGMPSIAARIACLQAKGVQT